MPAQYQISSSRYLRSAEFILECRHVALAISDALDEGSLIKRDSLEIWSAVVFDTLGAVTARAVMTEDRCSVDSLGSVGGRRAVFATGYDEQGYSKNGKADLLHVFWFSQI